MLKNISILIVEPEEATQSRLYNVLSTRTAASLFHAKNPTEAMAVISETSNIKVLITDLFPPEKEGLTLIQEGCGKIPAMVPVVITPLGSREHIVEALQSGVYFYMNTPFDYQEVIEVVKNAVEYQKLLASSLEYTPKPRKSDGFEGIIGQSHVMQELFSIIRNVTANNNGNILLKGESGTGKELAAHAIHKMTPDRSRHNLVPVNCAAIPDDLLESELFGYEKGAFTGATRSKKGRLEHADKGTLFLDEIGDMKPNMQAKLLRVLQEHAFEPVGSVKTREIDIRVIAATNRNLNQAVREGAFREDLYYRLSVIPITIPPLRDRSEDIDPLVETFLLMFNRGRQMPIQGFTRAAMDALKAYHWPGNVRELQNLMQRICILHSGNTVGIDALPKRFKGLQLNEQETSPETAPANHADGPAAGNHTSEAPETAGAPIDFHQMTYEFENRLILQALHSTDWNKKEAARLLNMKRTTLLEKIKKRNLERQEVA